MKQSRAMSLVESLANVAIGFWVAVLTQMVVLPLFDFEAPVSGHLAIAGIFTVLCRAQHNTVYAERMIMRSRPGMYVASS